eukprot:1143816-Prymnesium_polylepis.1
MATPCAGGAAGPRSSAGGGTRRQIVAPACMQPSQKSSSVAAAPSSSAASAASSATSSFCSAFCSALASCSGHQRPPPSTVASLFGASALGASDVPCAVHTAGRPPWAPVQLGGSTACRQSGHAPRGKRAASTGDASSQGSGAANDSGVAALAAR